MKIIIETIPHDQQRYPTVGDWYWSVHGNELHIKVSELGDWRYEVCVAIHEAVEAVLCEHAGIKQAAVDEFDQKFEKERDDGRHALADEPGDDKDAPYRKQHGIATGVERVLAAELGVDWNDYDHTIQNL
jgi:hypothetical protein